MKLHAPCAGLILFLFSISMSAYFVFWFVTGSDDALVHDVLVEHDKLVISGKRREAFLLLDSMLSAEDDGPLDPVWLPIIRIKSSGYERLGYYIRVLYSDPEREYVYDEVANFMELAPKSFHDEVKPRYLEDMNNIEGIRQDFLKKYGLLAPSTVD